jgi:adenosylhomocysteine nucleosidase
VTDAGEPVGEVLVLAPMTMELKAVAGALSLQRQPRGVEPSWRGSHRTGSVAAVLGGVGYDASAKVVARELDRRAYDRVVVCGIAGGLRPGIALGEVVVPERVVDLVSGSEHRPTPLPGTTSAGTLACHSEFITDDDTVRGFVERGFAAIDMETAAVAKVCEARGCSWSVVRSVSDVASDHEDDSIIHMLNPDGSVRPAAAARYVATHPGRVPGLIGLAQASTRAARNAATTLSGSLRA